MTANRKLSDKEFDDLMQWHREFAAEHPNVTIEEYEAALAEYQASRSDA